MKIDVNFDTSSLRKQFAEFSDNRFKSAISTALTRTAVKVRDVAKQEAQAKLNNVVQIIAERQDGRITA